MHISGCDIEYALTAIEMFDGYNLDGKFLRVNEAQAPRRDRG